MSRIGSKPIDVPAGVKVAVDGARVAVEGPKGKLAWALPDGVRAKLESGKITVARASETRRARSLHGLSRSLLANMVEGVTAGYKKQLEIQGTGFKAAVTGQKLSLNLGKSHPIDFEIPPTIKISVADNTQITIEGPDKQLVGEIAARIRRYYPAEPYKGKGVRYLGEVIRRKEGKTVQ